MKIKPMIKKTILYFVCSILISCSIDNQFNLEQFTILQLQVLTSLTGVEKQNQLSSNTFGDRLTARFPSTKIYIKFNSNDTLLTNTTNIVLKKLRQTIDILDFEITNKNIEKNIIFLNNDKSTHLSSGSFTFYTNLNGDIIYCDVNIKLITKAVILNEIINCLGIEDNVWLPQEDVLNDKKRHLNSNISFVTKDIIKFHYTCLKSNLDWQTVRKIMNSNCAKEIFKTN